MAVELVGKHFHIQSNVSFSKPASTALPPSSSVETDDGMNELDVWRG
jgi:hypothetical protein